MLLFIPIFGKGQTNSLLNLNILGEVYMKLLRKIYGLVFLLLSINFGLYSIPKIRIKTYAPFEEVLTTCSRFSNFLYSQKGQYILDLIRDRKYQIYLLGETNKENICLFNSVLLRTDFFSNSDSKNYIISNMISLLYAEGSESDVLESDILEISSFIGLSLMTEGLESLNLDSVRDVRFWENNKKSLSSFMILLIRLVEKNELI